MASDTENVRGERPIDVAILLRNPLDSDGILCQMQSQRQFRVVGSAESLNGFVQQCEHVKPRVAIMDAAYPILGGDVFAAGASLIQQHNVERILFLDMAGNRTRAQQALNVPNAGYVTHQRTFRQLVDAIADLVSGHIPLDVFDAKSFRSRGAVSTSGPATNTALAQLSAREVDVLQLLAGGMSVADCAKNLRVSVNTVESHKARMMNKLGVHRASQLTLIAVREGLIVP